MKFDYRIALAFLAGFLLAIGIAQAQMPSESYIEVQKEVPIVLNICSVEEMELVVDSPEPIPSPISTPEPKIEPTPEPTNPPTVTPPSPPTITPTPKPDKCRGNAYGNDRPDCNPRDTKNKHNGIDTRKEFDDAKDNEKGKGKNK